MLINMIHDNHGEPPFKTRYRDPAVLRQLGYEAIVIPDALAAVPGAYDAAERGIGRRENEPGSATQRKPWELEAAIEAEVKAATEQGMQVYFYGDAFLLPLNVVSKRPGDFYCEDNSGRICPGKHAVYEMLQEQIEELFDRWPVASGLVMRTGEVYPEATPHMVGSALHAGNCQVCREVSLVERLVRFITAMHATVIGTCKKTYVHRAWMPAVPGLPNMHDDSAVYREVSGRVPASEELRFSFKFTRGDFRAGSGEAFNPCVLADDRRKWIEFQCELEYEGKGAIPNYQGPLWRDFLGQLARDAGSQSLKNRFDLWGWARGGGWGGPYVQREEWIDVNVQALGALYRVPEADPAELAQAWAASAFGVAESSPPAPAIAELLLLSAPVIRKLLYVSALAGKSGAETAWVKDDVLDVEAVYASAVRAVESGVLTAAIQEKREALEGVDRITRLFDIASPELPNKSQSRDITNCLAYFQSFAGTVAHLFMGFARYTAWVNSGRIDADMAEGANTHLQMAQSQWQLHTQRFAMQPGAPTMFNELGLWDRTNACLVELQEE